MKMTVFFKYIWFNSAYFLSSNAVQVVVMRSRSCLYVYMLFRCIFWRNKPSQTWWPWWWWRRWAQWCGWGLNQRRWSCPFHRSHYRWSPPDPRCSGARASRPFLPWFDLSRRKPVHENSALTSFWGQIFT